MKLVDINIYCIAQTQMNRDVVRQWLDSMGATEAPIDTQETISDGEQIVGLAGKLCYKSFQPGLNPNVTKVRKEWGAYFDNILQSGHGSIIEHTNYTYAFENVSRIFTAEMNRHRAGVAVSEQSLRYVRFEDIPFWIPPSLEKNPSDDANDAQRKEETIGIIKDTIGQIEKSYMKLVQLWGFDNMNFHQKKLITSMLRRIIPLGVATNAVYTMNGRAIRHICTMRCDPAAEEEICYVFSRVAKDMISRAPLIMKDFKQTKEGFWYPEFRKV